MPELVGSWPMRTVVAAVVDCVVSRIAQSYDIRSETEMIGGKLETRWVIKDLRSSTEVSTSNLIQNQ